MFSRIRGYFANFGKINKETEDLVDKAIKRQRGLRRGGFLDPRYWAKGIVKIAFVQRTAAPAQKTNGRKKAASTPAPRARLSVAGWIMIVLIIGLVVFLLMPKNRAVIEQAVEEVVEYVERPAEAPTPTERIYVVKKGDWLSKISKKYYGKTMDYKIIQRANEIANPNAIEIGDKLVIPEK